MTHQTGRFTRDTAGSQSLERGLVLLRAFRVGTTSLTNAELAARTGLPRPTVSRLTRSLVDAGFLRYDVNERAYRLAPVVLSLADAFRHDWHVICPDLRGHGDSQWSPDGNYAMSSYIYDLDQLIHQQGLAPVTIIAHSLGGNICLRYSGVYPEKVRKLVAIAAHRPVA